MGLDLVLEQDLPERRRPPDRSFFMVIIESTRTRGTRRLIQQTCDLGRKRTNSLFTNFSDKAGLMDLMNIQRQPAARCSLVHFVPQLTAELAASTKSSACKTPARPTTRYLWQEQERQEESLSLESKGCLCKSRETRFSLAPPASRTGTCCFDDDPQERVRGE
ncbi:hypothetical protein NDU88_000692 [Pleurodeles waltl]|uniref:Uncharacterized protein n=1 Tax=Pleurodeles waltl TaxID=8319 RepID=A0AAV7P371_PLEWA|nr:hypothetical protein NDU88_000692 [Pleurodeles waltl]